MRSVKSCFVTQMQVLVSNTGYRSILPFYQILNANTDDDDNDDKARPNIVEESVGPLTDAFNYIWMVIRGETGSAEKLRSGSKWLFLAGE